MDNIPDLINITELKPLYDVRFIKDLKDMIVQSGELFGDKAAFRFRNSPQSEIESKSYYEALGDMNALGSALIEIGLIGSNIAIIGENRYEWIVSYLAVANGVGVAVPLDKMLPQNEIERMLKRGEADAVIYSESFHDDITKMAACIDGLKACICMNPSEGINVSGFKAHQYYSFADLLKKGYDLINNGYNAYTDINLDNSAMNILLFTSGTSSDSKAVMLSHENICSDIMGIGGMFYAKEEESVLSILPLHHTFENTAGLLYPLYCGMTVAISDGLKYLSRNLTEYKPDILIGVPLIFEKFKKKVTDEIKKKGMSAQVRFMMGATRLLRYIGLDLRRQLFKKLLEPFGGKLRAIITGGAAMEPDLARWYDGIGVSVHQGYGLTETSPVAAGCNDKIQKPGTCGNPIPGVKIAISDPDSKGSGEIVIKGKTVMLGYWQDPKATKEAITDGWFHTGDLGIIDKRGMIHITGRVKSMIVLNNGKKVFPEESESLLNKLDFVKESFVWGETGGNGQIEICAKIILDAENMPCDIYDDETIRKLLNQTVKDINKQMPAYKMIRYYVFGYAELVKTTTLKIKRYVEAYQIHKVLAHFATTIKNACGCNFDRFDSVQ